MISAMTALTDKLAAEGERTAAFFTALPAEHHDAPVYPHGAAWSVRQTLEHLIVSERSLLTVFRDVAGGGPGAPAALEIESFNYSHTGALAHLSFDELIDAFLTQRQETTTFARTLSDKQLVCSGRHPALGQTTLLEMLRLVPLHNSMHLRDLRKAL